ILSASTVTLIQLFVLFWLSFNIMLVPRMRPGSLYALVLSCTFLAVLQALGLTTEEIAQGRISVVGENANTLSAVLALGLIALTGLAFGRGKTTLTSRVFFMIAALVLTMEIVRTGSRASAIALAVSLLVFVLKKARSILPKLKIAIVTALVV